MKSKETVRNELVIDSPVGKLRLSASDKGLTAIDVKAKYSKDATKPDGRAQQILAETRKQLAQYFAGDRKKFDIPLDLHGTPFQVKAWKTLTRIPYGKTISYGEQARAMRKGKAFRAVGSANGKNPIPIIVPCHRVIASDGGLGGYSLGLAMKRKLMKLEGISADE
jgi:methylated-DNA-[protein]-cysteine S-methyltransferase